MAASTSLATSQQLLKRFMAREIARTGGAKQLLQPAQSSASSNSISSSSSSSPSFLSWSRSSNPFLPSKNQFGRNVKPLYSLRRQKMLHRAFERVQEASSSATPVASTSSSSASVSAYVLPPGSPKAALSVHQQQKESATSSRLHKLKDDSTRSNQTAISPVKVPSSGTAKMRQAVQSGPYKGRRNVVFKGHKWERERESVLAEREEKIKSMPARIAEYTKSRAAARAASKPTLPF